MSIQPNKYRLTPGPRRSRTLLTGFVAGLVAAFALVACLYFFGDGGGEAASSRAAVLPAVAMPVPVQAKALPEIDDKRWDGPILYHGAPREPLHLILVEKAIQKLHLYRYDGAYQRIKTYACATGEKDGPKRREKDERTPVGIYFNTKTYRDKKITVFGDRAFELNYPDPFDRVAGNGGSGIYIHGSNRRVTPNSTNGCVAMDNQDLADLDSRVRFDRTPVIIGERLPYRFGPARRDLSPMMPFLKQAMVPRAYAEKPTELSSLTLIGFQGRMVALGRLKVFSETEINGVSRLYLADAAEDLLVLFRREWALKGAPEPRVARPAVQPRPSEETRVTALVASWRRAWQGQHLESYINHYHPEFHSSGKDLSQWKAYKGRLNRKYKKISVTVSGLRVRIEAGRARAYFRQRYRSDAFRSNGFKILEFRKKGGAWKIFREISSAEKPAGWPA